LSSWWSGGRGAPASEGVGDVVVGGGVAGEEGGGRGARGGQVRGAARGGIATLSDVRSNPQDPQRQDFNNGNSTAFQQ
jgi:hypothetical protein